MARAEHPEAADESAGQDRILLLGFSPDGRMIVARNDPDQARCVVVLVPGIGTTAPDSILLRAESFYRQIAAAPDDDTISVITWADYLAPRLPDEARDRAPAEGAAARLAGFVAGLRLTSRFQAPGNRARITVVGHGYGGLVAGLAARDEPMDVDAMVFLGSVSAGTDTADGLRVAGPVYATSPDVNGDGTPYGVHGPRPDSAGFGARVLQPGPLSYGDDPAVRYLPSLRRIVLGTD
ncbi:alpha/beta hydrolase [Streptomyces sp. NPDC006012]|uniref:alpha/beta hydrolase n=1 Tax=Streptomyces sp. NPDC006012 TaxID=3364739 RepID=UPI0036C71108